MKKLREKIDKIDDKLVELFDERMKISKEVFYAKKNINKAINDSKREDEIIERLTKKYPQNKSYIKNLYQSIFSISKSIQVQEKEENDFERYLLNSIKNPYKDFNENETIAIQGTKGSYGDIAVDKVFTNAKKTFLNSFDDVFDAVSNGICKFGVLPIENSIYGSVNEVYDLMVQNKFSIIGEYKLPIKHYLLAKKGTKLENVKKALSHYQALGQCNKFFKEHPQIEKIQYKNTALAAEYVSKSNRDDICCISSKKCKDIFNLEILSSDIQNDENNFTRFIIISKEMISSDKSNKISIIVEAEHKPGALFDLIGKFSSIGLNLTKIESRPIKGKDFEFLFYFDFFGNIKDKEVRKLLSELNDRKEYFSFLGNYVEY